MPKYSHAYWSGIELGDRKNWPAHLSWVVSASGMNTPRTQINSWPGFDGPIRPDHAPTMEGEPNEKPGYAMSGKISAFGYMKGTMRAYEFL